MTGIKIMIKQLLLSGWRLWMRKKSLEDFYDTLSGNSMLSARLDDDDDDEALCLKMICIKDTWEYTTAYKLFVLFIKLYFQWILTVRYLKP